MAWRDTGVGDHCGAKGDVVVCNWTESVSNLVETGREDVWGEIVGVSGWRDGGV